MSTTSCTTRSFPAPPPDWGSDQVDAYEAFKTYLLRLQEILDLAFDKLARRDAYAAILTARQLLAEIAGIESKHSTLIFKNRSQIEQSLDRGECLVQPLFSHSASSNRLIAIVDTESTGLDEVAQPVSVGAILLEVEHESGAVLRELANYYGTREPTVPINPEAAAVNGLSYELLRGTAFDMMALYKIIDSADLLIAHNAFFDRRMLAHVMPRILDARWACTLELLPQYWRRPSPRAWTLDAICAAIGATRCRPHHALQDCRSLLSVLMANRGKTERSQRFLRCLLHQTQLQ